MDSRKSTSSVLNIDNCLENMKDIPPAARNRIALIITDSVVILKRLRSRFMLRPARKPVTPVSLRLSLPLRVKPWLDLPRTVYTPDLRTASMGDSRPALIAGDIAARMMARMDSAAARTRGHGETTSLRYSISGSPRPETYSSVIFIATTPASNPIGIDTTAICTASCSTSRLTCEGEPPTTRSRPYSLVLSLTDIAKLFRITKMTETIMIKARMPKNLVNASLVVS